MMMPEPHRRLAAIVFFDVAGSGIHMEADEAGTFTAFADHRKELIEPRISYYTGRVVNPTGDGVLAEFPSVINAVKCAVSIQRGMGVRNADVPEDRRLELRIGINLDDVIVDENDIHGVGVHIAAALEGFADPGGICISQRVYEGVESRLDLIFDDMGDQQIKNLTKPVRVYKVTIVEPSSAPWVVSLRDLRQIPKFPSRPKDYFSPDQPFGPATAPLEAPSDEFVAKSLNDIATPITPRMPNTTCFVIGRRGSGKTALLQADIIANRFDIIIELESAQIFEEIVISIEELCTPFGIVETTAKLWDILFWTPLFVRLCAMHQEGDETDIDRIRQYLNGARIQPEFTNYQAIGTMVDVLSDLLPRFRTLSRLLEFATFNDLLFSEVKNITLNYMITHRLSCVILMDSLEDFRLDCSRMNRALEGLLRCVGQFRQYGETVVVRCVLPAEIYHRLLKISSNVNKDFENKIQLLHWNPTALMRIAALRYSSYLHLYSSEPLKGDIGRLNLHEPSGSARWLKAIFSEAVINGLGIKEDPLPYILRHTQLQPRHIIMYMNQIALQSQHKFNGDAIRESVSSIQDLLCEQILSAYEPVWPDARDACKVLLPHLSILNSYDDLRHTFEDVKWESERHYQNNKFDDIVTMLVEIGALGRVIDTGKGYVIGLFEYRCPLRLHINHKETYCIHPLFVRWDGSDRTQDIEEFPLVYPFGSTFGSEDLGNLRLGPLQD